MTYEMFQETVKREIGKYFPKDAEVSITPVTKNNDQVYYGLIVREKGQDIMPTIYLDEFYNRYEDGEAMEDIILDLAEIYKNSAKKGGKFDITSLQDWNHAKKNILPCLLNKENNAEYLKNMVYKELSNTDLAVCYKIHLAEGVTVTITEGLLERYDQTLDELHEVAMENLKGQIKFLSMADMLAEIDPAYAAMFPPIDQYPMYVLTNEAKIYGAAGILDTDLMDHIAKELGDNPIILPSSLHEVIIVPEGFVKGNPLEDMVHDINQGQVEPDERLSDRVYLYDSKKHELMFYDDFLKTHEEEQEQDDISR